MADLLDEGTRELDGLALHDALARIGAQFDCDVGVDATVVTLVTLKRFAREAVALLSAVVNRPRFDDADFERVRGIRASRLMQLSDVPAAVAERLFAYRLYGAHPYGHTSLGTVSALRRAHRRRCADVPSRRADGRRRRRSSASAIWRTKSSSSWCRRSGRAATGRRARAGSLVAPGWRPVERPPSISRLALAHRPGAAQSELRIGCVAAARSTPDYVVLAVLNTALGGAFVSRINLKLREEKGFTYGARSAFDYRRQPGPFVVQASVQTDATAEAVQDVLPRSSTSADRGRLRRSSSPGPMRR